MFGVKSEIKTRVCEGDVSVCERVLKYTRV